MTKKSVIKSAYLLQLKHGTFSAQELATATGKLESFSLKRLLSEKLVRKSKRRGRFTLSEKGRGQLTVVLAGGVYDVIHLGHLAALSEARKLGDVLLVMVASDSTVVKFKQHQPTFPQEDRRMLVEALKAVDAALAGYEDVGAGFERVLLEVRPDIVALGHDQGYLDAMVHAADRKHRLDLKVVRLARFDRAKYVSSAKVKKAGFQLAD
jgi:cytidyltransferase-like protein